jgi:hypothetical protein
MARGAILARETPSAPACRHQLANHNYILSGCFSYLKTDLGASALQRRQRLAKGWAICAPLSYGGRRFLKAGHVGPRSRFLAGEFLDKMSGKAGESV